MLVLIINSFRLCCNFFQVQWQWAIADFSKITTFAVRFLNGKGRYQSGQLGQTVNLLAYAFVGSNPALPTTCRCSSGVEHFLGKEGVTSSILVIGSKQKYKATPKGVAFTF